MFGVFAPYKRIGEIIQPVNNATNVTLHNYFVNGEHRQAWKMPFPLSTWCVTSRGHFRSYGVREKSSAYGNVSREFATRNCVC